MITKIYPILLFVLIYILKVKKRKLITALY